MGTFEKLSTNSGMARRDFLKWTGMAAGAVAGSSLLAACGSGKPSGSGASGASGGPAKYQWRTGTVVAEADPFYQYLVDMAKAIKSNTNGAVEITVYPSGQLGAETDTFKLLQSGGIQFQAISVATVNATVPSTILYSLPYVLDPSNPQKMHSVLNGATNQKQKDDLGKLGVNVLGFVNNGTRQLGGTKTFSTPADIKGVKIRIPGTPLYQSVFQSMGAIPTPVALTDTYSALKQGLVSAYEQPLAGVLAEKWYESANKITMIEYSITPVFVAINNTVWNGLPSDVKKGIQAGVDSVGKTFDTTTLPAAATKAQQSLTSLGVTFDKPDLAPWRSAVTPVYQQFADQVGGLDLINKVRQ